jgi:tetratricopeptide (TPR) repeat protein
MILTVRNSGGKLLIAAAALLLSTGYLILATREFLAAHFAARDNLSSLQRAIRFDPGNADYRYRLGRYLWFVQGAPEDSIEPYLAAVRLNPFEARAWFDLAAVYQYLGDTDRQEDALRHAVEVAPSTPDVAWEAANLYVVRGETDKALQEFRVVLANDPYRPPSALQICWHIQPDIDVLLRDVVPPKQSVYSSFLEFLISKKESAAAAKVWAAMSQLGQPVERRYTFGYIRYLIIQGEIDQSRLVWQQAANLSQLSRYQPSTDNLVVNGDFSLDVLNGGFDWIYYQPADVSLELDPTQPHSSSRSLRIIFDSRGLEDAGIRQFIPVQPNTGYEFSANFRSEDMEGAGGPRFALQDAYSGDMLFASDPLTNAGFWKNVDGTFTTGPQAKLLVLRVQRVPPGSPIKGKLWIDGLRLTAQTVSGGTK